MITRKMKFKVLLSMLLFAAGNVFAQSESDTLLYEMSLEDLMTVRIVSASKFEQSIKDAPSNVSLVSRQQIIDFGWLSSNDVLARMPGFAVSQDFERQTISSRGVFESWNSNHMLSLIDGVPMNTLLSGSSISDEATPLLFTKSLEVIRGPGSSLYGSNATNGVISYNTVSASEMKNKVELRFRNGSWNTRIFDFLTAHENNKVSIVSAFNFFNTEGFSYNSLDARNAGTFDIDHRKSSYYVFNKIKGQGKFDGLSFQHHEQAWEFSTGHGWLNMVPDNPENMKESRRVFILKYTTPDSEKKFQHEYVLKYHNNSEDYNQRFFPAGDPYYTEGLTEILKSSFSDYFARSQWSQFLTKTNILLGGIEFNIFDYNGDKVHLSNAFLDGDYSPTPNNELVAIGHYLPWLNGNSYQTAGVYTQWQNTWGAKLSTTLGVRYDRAWFGYNDLEDPDQPTKNKAYAKLNPRLSVVFHAANNITIKAMAGNAFRSPSPFELFVGNSYNGAANLKELKPETITTYELESDIQLMKQLTWRLNAFHTEVNDVIAYGSGNVLINLFSVTSAGLESEIQYRSGSWDAFFNYSYTKRLDEKRTDPLIETSPSMMTWYPGHLLNGGMNYKLETWNMSMQYHVQGKVNRKTSDQSAEFDQLRGATVKQWSTLDFKCNKEIGEHLLLGFQLNNAFNKKGYFMKTYLNPYDYQMPGRRLLLDVMFKF